VPPGDWAFAVRVNVWGIIHGIRHFVPAILKHGEDGHVVNTASVAGFQNRRGTSQGPYSMTKYAALSLSEALEHELEGTNVGVTVLCPGPINTNIARGGRNRPDHMGGPQIRPSDEAILAERPAATGLDPKRSSGAKADHCCPALRLDQTRRGEQSVKFSFSSEQEEFRSNLRRFLADRSPTEEVRRLIETDDGYERDGWRAINAELGLTAIRIPEAYGGHGFGFGEQCIVLEEMGRALLCAPYFATAVLAAGVITNAGTERQKQALLPGIAAGEKIAALAWVEDNGRWDAEGTALTATAVGGGTVLNGHKTYVVDGHTADLIVVLARAPQGLSLFTVDGNAAGLTRRSLKSMDPTRKFARLEFKDVAASPLGAAGCAAAPFARTVVEPRSAWPTKWSAARTGCGRTHWPIHDAHAIRQAHRFFPVDEAQAGRYAARGGIGKVGRLLRRGLIG
jgi:NAD(P)-dependent dehydrogenase (short-subunit alcohol dehydrogenase family)